jgi:hypothetical protein
MPGYYVVVAGREVVIRASGDGHVTGSVTIPGPAGDARSPVSGEPFGTADDGHVIVVSRGGDLPGVALAFGRIDNGIFTLLPGLPPGDQPAAATW